MKTLYRLLLKTLFLSICVAVAHAKNLTHPATTSLSFKCTDWTPVELTPVNWAVAYDGHGRVEFNKVLTLSPRSVASTEPTKTHAALVLSKGQLQDFGIRVQFQNKKAHRTPASNTWEVFWLMFNYQGTPKAKTTNYFIFKPNGIELGKAWKEVDQKFLATRNEPQAKLRENYELTLYKKGQHIEVLINGQPALDYLGSSENTLYDQPGQIGLYTEDAHVEVSKVELCTGNSKRVLDFR